MINPTNKTIQNKPNIVLQFSLETLELINPSCWQVLSVWPQRSHGSRETNKGEMQLERDSFEE